MQKNITSQVFSVVHHYLPHLSDDVALSIVNKQWNSSGHVLLYALCKVGYDCPVTTPEVEKWRELREKHFMYWVAQKSLATRCVTAWLYIW